MNFLLQNAISHHQQGNLELAEAAYVQALKASPRDVNALYNYAILLHSLGRANDALKQLEKTTKLAPTFAQAFASMGSVLFDLGHGARARLAFEKAVSLQPNMPNPWFRLGEISIAEAAYKKALIQLEKAYQLGLKTAQCAGHLYYCHLELKQFDQAEHWAKTACELAPNNPHYVGFVRKALCAQGRHNDARALALSAGAELGSSALRLAGLLTFPPVLASQTELDNLNSQFDQEIAALQTSDLACDDPLNEGMCVPFYLAYQGTDNSQRLSQISDIIADSASCYHHPLPSPSASAPRKGKIRLGILSLNLKDHTIEQLYRGLILQFAKSGEFELVVIGHSHSTSEAIKKAAHQFIDIPGDLLRAAEMIAKLGLDVLFYPDIGMNELSYFLAHYRLAPVQCTSWGHPVTTGIATMDYYLSSRLIETEHGAKHYRETLIKLNRLPCYYDMPGGLVTSTDRAKFHLSDQERIYLFPQTSFKALPGFDPIIGEILARDDKARFVMLDTKMDGQREMLEARITKTLAPYLDRITFLDRMSRGDFIDLLNCADIQLDSPYFSGGNSSYEALALGRPIVTLPGDLMCSRVTTGLYAQLGIDGLCAQDAADYVAKAIDIAASKDLQAAFKAKILAGRDQIFADQLAVEEMIDFFRQAHHAAQNESGPISWPTA